MKRKIKLVKKSQVKNVVYRNTVLWGEQGHMNGLNGLMHTSIADIKLCFFIESLLIINMKILGYYIVCGVSGLVIYDFSILEFIITCCRVWEQH